MLPAHNAYCYCPVTAPVTAPITAPVTASLNAPVTVCPCHCPSHYLSLPLSLPLSLHLSLPLSLPPSLPLSLSVTAPVTASVTISLPPCYTPVTVSHSVTNPQLLPCKIHLHKEDLCLREHMLQLLKFWLVVLQSFQAFRKLLQLRFKPLKHGLVTQFAKLLKMLYMYKLRQCFAANLTSKSTNSRGAGTSGSETGTVISILAARNSFSKTPKKNSRKFFSIIHQTTIEN